MIMRLPKGDRLIMNLKATNDVMTVTCDACKVAFDPDIRTRREGGEGEIEVTYFICPECNCEYEVCRTNPELRKLQQKVENMRVRIVKQRAAGTLRGRRLKEFQELTRTLKVKMDEFNAARRGATNGA